MRRHPTALGAGVVAAVALLVGCGGGTAVDKQGAPATRPTVLHVGAADTDDDGLQYFVQAVARASKNRLLVDVDQKTYFSETPGGEAKLAGDLRAGKVDFAYVPSRDWAGTGDPGFRAVQAPFLVSTTAATTALATSSVAKDLLSGLDAYGAVGLGLVPGEVRRLMARNPITEVGDLKGAKVRIGDSAQTAQLMSALGATAVQGKIARGAADGLSDGSLDAVETAPTYAVSNSYNVPAPYLTSFAMFPKFEVLMANKAAWAKLGDADQRAVRAAAAETVTRTVRDLPAQEQGELTQLCRNGAVIVQPAEAAVTALAAQGAEATPTDAATVRAIAKISDAIETSGAHPAAGPVPSTCGVASTAAQARSMHAAATGAPTPDPKAAEPFPTGTFAVTVTKAQWAAAGLFGRDNDQDITFTFVFGSDGKLRETQQPDFPDQGPAAGTWTVKGDQVTLNITSGGSPDVTVETVRWSYYRGVLTFVPVSVQDAGSRAIYGQPWRKVG